MNEPSVDVAPRPRAGERVVVHVDSPAARWVGALALLCAVFWLVADIASDYGHANWPAVGRLAWSLTILAAVALIARGIFLGRPVTARHATAAAGLVFAGLGAHVLSFDLLGDLLIVVSGLALMWPRPLARNLPSCPGCGR